MSRFGAFDLRAFHGCFFLVVCFMSCWFHLILPFINNDIYCVSLFVNKFPPLFMGYTIAFFFLFRLLNKNTFLVDQRLSVVKTTAMSNTAIRWRERRKNMCTYLLMLFPTFNRNNNRRNSCRQRNCHKNSKYWFIDVRHFQGRIHFS